MKIRRWRLHVLWELFVFAVFTKGFDCLVDVHFENKEGGFFLKHIGASHQQQQSSQSSSTQQQSSLNDFENIVNSLDGGGSVDVGGDSTVLSLDRFTVFHHSHPASVRAVYGPFSTKQTVPARYIVPDPPPPPPPLPNTTSIVTGVVDGNGSSYSYETKARVKSDPLTEMRHLEVSAHLVNHEIARDSPVLRVLFHVSGIDRSVRKYGKSQTVCVVLHVVYADRSPLSTACSPSIEDGHCLAEITIPSIWWPPLPNLDQTKTTKTPRKSVQVSYYVLEPKIESRIENTADNVAGDHWRSNVAVTENCSPHLQIQPLAKIDSVPLVNARYGYRELKMEDPLFTLVPTAPLYPRSKIYVPVYARFKLKENVVGFIIKARVKSGLKIVDAYCREPDYWKLNFEPNHKFTAATVMVVFKNMPVIVHNRSVSVVNTEDTPNDENSQQTDERIEEVFSWLLEVEHDSSGDIWNEEAHIVWTVHYVNANNVNNPFTSSDDTNVSKMTKNESPSVEHSIIEKKHAFKTRNKRTDKTKRKIATKFEIHKDITQAVLPVSKTWELINTAILTGKQVSQPMKIFVVSQSGKIADVTRQSTCHTEDDSVLKVTSSCSSVYVDGSEIRGSSNATILVKYETFTGTASFIAWMPEITELDIAISDVKLSQIYDWVVPNTTVMRSTKTKRSSKSYEKLSDDMDSKWRYQKFGKNVNSITFSDNLSTDNGKSNSMCKLKYQEATIDVYTRFKAVDHDTGRVSYLINRKTWLKITDSIIHNLRIADPFVAALNGRIITGRNVGRTDVQIISPLTGKVLGSKEIRVVNDKVSITKLLVNVVSGLQLNIVPDSSGENIYIAETSITRKLSAQYQEGLLDIEVEFSDGSVTSVADINANDYTISVDSLSPDVVAFAPMLASRHPRVIAVGEGKGNLLKVSLLLPDACRAEARLRDYILVSTSAFVNVDYYDAEYGQKLPMLVQNDGGVSATNNAFFAHNGNAKDRKRFDSEQSSSDLQDILTGISPSNDISKEPALQARQHSNNKNNAYTSIRRHPTSHMAPMEMGMYIILATFSFAIIVFVVSCVIYASKYKPQSLDLADERGDTSYTSAGYKLLSNPANGNNSAKRIISNSREPTTTNVHDWVWLGRATWERASGLLVPSISHNDKMRRNKNDNWIRITSNPTYTPEPNPDTDLSMDNVRRNANPTNQHRIDSKTYKKSGVDLLRDSGAAPNTRQRCFRLPTVSCHPDRREKDDDFKPPVPPHRNIVGVANLPTTVSDSLSDASHRLHKHHHHHHHHRNHHHNHHHRHHHNHPIKDKYDELPAATTSRGSTDTYVIEKTTENDKKIDKVKPLQFVNISSENLSEIRKANIVGNPMFSVDKTEIDDNESLGIEDLNLGMDYKQIMEYFNNLKESTA